MPSMTSKYKSGTLLASLPIVSRGIFSSECGKSASSGPIVHALQKCTSSMNGATTKITKGRFKARG